MSVYGTARFAEKEDLRAAGLIKDRAPGEYPNGLMIGWWIDDIYSFQPIEYTGDLHQLIVAGTGGGKFTTALAPLIMGSKMNNTVVVVDPKGEIANIAGPYWEAPFGAQASVFLFDPWDQCNTGRCSALNVLDQITLSNPSYVDDARALADAIVMPSGGENTHWDNAARNFLTAILLHVALSPGEEGKRDLLRVRELVTLPWAMPKTYTGPKRETLSDHLFRWLDSDIAEGAVKRGASSILNREEKERSGIISSIERDTAWVDSPQMKKVLSGPAIDLATVGRGREKYFIILPPAFFMTHRGWLRLMVTTFANVFKRNPSSGQPGTYNRWRHIIIDEFATLGEMNFVLNDIAVARGFDVKYHLAIQDLSQLARVYTQGWESFINNTFQRFFAISDMFTAEYVSRMLGGTTVHSVGLSSGSSEGGSYADSTGNNQGSSFTTGGMGQPGSRTTNFNRNTGQSFNENFGTSNTRSINPAQRPLHTPDEVRRLGPNVQYIFIRGMYPIECWRPPYWKIFNTLPKHSLKEVLDTIGKPRPSDDEFDYYAFWHLHHRLMIPEKREVAPPPPVTPRVVEAKPSTAQSDAEPKQAKPLSRAWMAGILCALVFLYFVPPWDFHSFLTFMGYRIEDAVRAIRPSPSPSAARLASAPHIAPTGTAGATSRAPIPNAQAVSAMPAGEKTRDYLVNLITENMDRCALGHGESELVLMRYLVGKAIEKRGYVPPNAAAGAQKEYLALTLQRMLARPTWSLADNHTALGSIKTWIRRNNPSDPLLFQVLQRLYPPGRCPFGTVAESAYSPPSYTSVKPLGLPLAGR